MAETSLSAQSAIQAIQRNPTFMYNAPLWAPGISREQRNMAMQQLSQLMAAAVSSSVLFEGRNLGLNENLEAAYRRLGNGGFFVVQTGLVSGLHLSRLDMIPSPRSGRRGEALTLISASVDSPEHELALDYPRIAFGVSFRDGIAETAVRMIAGNEDFATQLRAGTRVSPQTYPGVAGALGCGLLHPACASEFREQFQYLAQSEAGRS